MKLIKYLSKTIDVEINGNTAKVDVDHIVHTNDIVEYGKRVTEPYKAVNRIVHPENTTVKVENVSIGEAAQPSCAVAY